MNFIVKGVRCHQGVMKYRSFECNRAYLPKAAEAAGWRFVSAAPVARTTRLGRMAHA